MSCEGKIVSAGEGYQRYCCPDAALHFSRRAVFSSMHDWC